MTETHVTIGANVDTSDLAVKAERSGDAGSWPVKKTAKIGDRIVLLVPAIHGEFCGHGVIAGKPESGSWGKSPRFFAMVKEFRRLNPPVPIATIQHAFPDWGWPKYARSFSSVPREIDEAFWQVLQNPPVANDRDEPPERVEAIVSRFVRDTSITAALKRTYEFKCQICGTSLQYGTDRFYAEVHHLRPLGANHNGPDAESNMLVLCPNHHALFDLSVPKFLDHSTLEIHGSRYRLTLNHRIAKEHIDYYMRQISSHCRRG